MPEGRHVASSPPNDVYVSIFDLQHPGVRKQMKFGLNNEFLHEWTPDSRAILIAKGTKEMEPSHLGVYRLDLDGHYKLVAPAAKGGFLLADRARYSPSGRLIAVESDNWFQILIPDRARR